jgi:hypothetical protein
LEDLLGCPREHLDFSLWYLKENALIGTPENERFPSRRKASIIWKPRKRAIAPQAFVSRG